MLNLTLKEQLAKRDPSKRRTQELLNQDTHLSISTTGSTVAKSQQQWEQSILSVHVPLLPHKKRPGSYKGIKNVAGHLSPAIIKAQTAIRVTEAGVLLAYKATSANTNTSFEERTPLESPT